MALILMIPGEGRMNAGFRLQVRCRHTDCLHAGFLVVRNDGHRVAWVLRGGGGFLQDLDVFVNAQDLHHLLGELGIAALEIVTHLVRLHLARVEDLADRALDQIGKAGMAGQRAMLTAWRAKSLVVHSSWG